MLALFEMTHYFFEVQEIKPGDHTRKLRPCH